MSIGLLGLLLARADTAGLLATFRAMDLSRFSLAALLLALGLVLSCARWRVLLVAAGIRVPFRRLLAYYFEGTFFSLFLPTVIGGDVVRGYRLWRGAVGGSASYASIVVERFTGLVGLTLIAAAALAAGWGPRGGDPIVTTLVVGLMAGTLMAVTLVLDGRLLTLLLRGLERLGLTRLQEAFRRFADALLRYRLHPGALLWAIGISVLFQAQLVVIYFVLARALALPVSLADLCLYVPLLGVASMVPLSLAGLGVRDGMGVYLFAQIGLPAAAALGLTLSWFLVMIAGSLPGALVFLLLRRPMSDDR